jgi:hypothetical protein
MDTDQLIRTLAADNTRARPVGFVLALALLAAAPVSLLMFFAELGVRPDVMIAMRNPFFDLKFAVTLALATSAILVSLHLSRPEASMQGWGWLFMIPAGLLVAGISALAGAVAGLLSAGLAATFYASHCTDDSPLFVATWYTIATALVTAIGALAGSKVLRF